MTLQQHISYVTNKTNMATRILYPLLNRRSKLDTRNKILLFKVALRPILSYAAPIFNDIAPTNKKKLQILQNKLLRLCLNRPHHYRTCDLHDEAGIEPINDFLERLTQRFGSSS